MSANRALDTLVAHRWWIYGVGLLSILGLRTLVAPTTARTVVVSLVLGLMVVTYAGELWVAGTGSVDRPLVLAAGVAGIVGGVWLTLSGTRAGVLFAGGGLLFLNRALTTGRGEHA